MYDVLKMLLVGQAPLLMHNGRLGNPRDEKTRALKALTSKKNKTDDDLIAISRTEFEGGLYVDAKDRPSITGDMVLGCGLEGARKLRMGKQFEPGVVLVEPFYTLVYQGPAKAKNLFDDPEFVDTRGAQVMGKQVQRTRPIFKQWEVHISVGFIASVIDKGQLLQCYEAAGTLCGLGDWRPRFGRFSVQVEE